jgi:NADPH-dependent curcumin reductase CurA
MAPTNRRIVLAERPQALPTEANFRLERVPVPDPGDGQVLLRTLVLSLDPYMRGRMSEGESYAPSVAVNAPMVGGTISRVVRSRASGFVAGDLVAAQGGWQDYSVEPTAGLRKLDPAAFPPSLAQGALGMPGLTAYVGLLDIGRPKAGETVVVSAASGAVGSAVGQIAKLKGCRAVGIAGGADKCAYVERELGFDACVDYRAADFKQRLRDAVPNGIDIYFENVGGPVGDACFALLNPFGRMPVCGVIANYNLTGLSDGPDRHAARLRLILIRRLEVRGFIVTDHWHRLDAFLAEAVPWVQSGQLKYREHWVDGLENAPRAFLGLFEGTNFGKLLVRVAE